MNSFRKVTLVTISDEEMQLAALRGEDCRDMERRAHEMYFGAGSWADIQPQIRRNIFLYSGCDDLFNEEPTLASEAFDDEWTYTDYLMGN